MAGALLEDICSRGGSAMGIMATQRKVLVGLKLSQQCLTQLGIKHFFKGSLGDVLMCGMNETSDMYF